MLSEGAVSVMALIAASSLFPLDYFPDQRPGGEVCQSLPMLAGHGLYGIQPGRCLSKEVGENIAGRTGGAVSLAVGMAQIFSSIPGLEKLMSYWYHFAIMFEALFILTIIDAGTRIARFVLQEIMGKIYKPIGIYLLGMARKHSRQPDRRLCLGVFRLHRQRQHYLADVRNGQPVAGNDRTGNRNILHHQPQQAQIRLDHHRSDDFRRDNHYDGRLHEHQKHLPSAGHGKRNTGARACKSCADYDYHGFAGDYSG